MHTGMLFLFPHILQVCLAAASCGHMSFSTTTDIWFRIGPDCFLCEAPIVEGPLQVSFLQLCMASLPAAFLWGLGTAIGEIPPYWVSRAARLAGEKDEEFEEMMHSSAKPTLFTRMRDWMIGFLENHGFIGVVLMASWPNMAFDMCGIACGHFGMPFWTFFGATVLGKGVFKVAGQTAFFVMLFSNTDANIEWVVQAVERLIPDNLEPCRYFLGGDSCDKRLHKALLKAHASFHKSLDDATEAAAQQSGSWLGMIWSWVIFLFVGYFVVGLIEGIAQAHQAHRDEIEAKSA